jgi:hypothetical protein
MNRDTKWEREIDKKKEKEKEQEKKRGKTQGKQYIQADPNQSP